MLYSLFQFLKVCFLVFSPHWEVELSYAEHIPAQWKLLHSSVAALSTYLLFSAGYEFFAGINSLYIAVTAGSLILSLLDGAVEEEDESDDK